MAKRVMESQVGQEKSAIVYEFDLIRLFRVRETSQDKHIKNGSFKSQQNITERIIRKHSI